MTNKYLFLIILSVYLFSCKEKIVFEKSKPISKKIWEISDTLEFETTINDTSNFYNIFIHIDAQENFLTNNIWLFVKSESPSGNILKDTVMFYLSDAQGKWFGKKQGETINNKFIYKAHIRFPEKGIYKFYLQHGMRENDLPRVSSVGISIEK